MIAMTADNDSEQTDEIIFHEYVHLLLRAAGERPPQWLNEGLAELFSTFKIEGDSYKMGLEKPAHTDLLRRVRLMPLGELFAVTRQSYDYNEGGIRQGIYYAESWAFVHFMVCGRDCATNLPKLRRFKELISAPDGAIDRSFREAFGMDYDEMEWKLKDYLRGGRYYFKRDKLILGDLSAQITFRPADGFERDVALIDLRWRAQKTGDAAYQLLQLAESHPESPRPHEVLAAVAMQGGDSEGALNHWQRAAELGSDNPFVYVQLATDRLNQLTMGLSLDYRMPAELAGTLRGWLDRAIALSPRYLEAYEALAMVEAFAERPRADAVNRVQEAAPKMKDKTRTWFAVAVIHWRMGDFGTARQITKALIAAPETPPQMRALARRLIKQLPPAETPAAAAVAAPPHPE
jgi:Flp pilus assembly protein TadD